MPVMYIDVSSVVIFLYHCPVPLKVRKRKTDCVPVSMQEIREHHGAHTITKRTNNGSSFPEWSPEKARYLTFLKDCSTIFNNQKSVCSTKERES